MGNFNQHITCSTITGVCLGGIAYQFGFSIPVCLLSAGLCSMAGMLPDIDSDSSRSFQECIYFAAGLCAVLLVDRLRLFNIDRDTILLAGAAAFMFVRFGVGNMIKHFTSHRGMLHSVPAAVFAGQIVFILSAGTIIERLCKSSALIAGYLSHLILDEICSVDSTGKSLRLKKSFGTALKFYDSKKLGTSLALYAVIIGLTAFVVKNPISLDGSESLETRIRLALEDSPLKQQDIASLVSFVKKNMLQKDGTEDTAVSAVLSTAQKIPATVQEQMKEEAANIAVSNVAVSSGIYSADNSDSRKNADYQMFAKTNNIDTAGIDANLVPLNDLQYDLTPAEVHKQEPQIVSLPFQIPSSAPVSSHTAVLPFEIPPAGSNNTANVNTAPQLPFALPF